MASGSVSVATLAQKYNSSSEANSLVLRDNYGGVTHQGVTTGMLDNSGAEAKTYTAEKTSEYSVTAPSNGTGGDCVILCDTTSGGFVINLPLASAFAGQSIYVKKTTGDANGITITRAGSDTIDGGTTMVLTGAYQCAHLVNNGVDTWHCLNS